MNRLESIQFVGRKLGAVQSLEGQFVCLVQPEANPGPVLSHVDVLTGRWLSGVQASKKFTDMNPGQLLECWGVSGIGAERCLVVKLPDKPGPVFMRRTGAKIGKKLSDLPVLVEATAGTRNLEYLAQGMTLGGYRFDRYKRRKIEADPDAAWRIMAPSPATVTKRFDALRPEIEGVQYTQDLVNEPSNVLTTCEFARRLCTLREIGVEVEEFDEDELEQIGMRALLAVGQGSDSPSKVVVMRWRGGASPPVALIGKGVVFDTGGISIKPASGMEQMTMDMAGAGTVAGVMKSLALGNARANVVGVVGLVENMPSGSAQRPGDIVRTLKGDTVEVVNTDAEGRLVLADIMWYAQERFKPVAMVDLATLTGAIIVSLGHEYCGAFSNNDSFYHTFEKVAGSEDENVWRQPMSKSFDKIIDSKVADMKNIGDRWAGAVTAAQFLKRFVRPGLPWIHLDIAGVAWTPKESKFAPLGATGWGVRSLSKLIVDHYSDT